MYRLFPACPAIFFFTLRAMHYVGGLAPAAPQTPSSNDWEQPWRQEVQRCHDIAQLFVYASIGSMVLAFCSGEQHTAGARLLTWPLDNWISEDMIWYSHIHMWRCVMGSDTWHAWKNRVEMWWRLRPLHKPCPVSNARLSDIIIIILFWKSMNLNPELLLVPVTVLELSTVLNTPSIHLHNCVRCILSHPSSVKTIWQITVFFQLMIDKNWQWKTHKG